MSTFLSVRFSHAAAIDEAAFCQITLDTCLASSANLLALISFFFNDCMDNNYLRIRWADFRNFFTE